MTRLDGPVYARISEIVLSRVGEGQAITGAEIVAVCRASGLTPHLRRVGESVQLMRQEGHPVLSTSARGYYLASTEDERAEAASELRKRIAALARSLAAVDRACAGRIQIALYLGGALGQGEPASSGASGSRE